MKNIKFKLSAASVIIFILIFTGTSLSQNIKLNKSVIGGGGAITLRNSEKMKLSGIYSQIAIEKRINLYDGDSLNLYQGFWVPLSEIPTGIDIGKNPFGNDLSNYPNPFRNSTTIRYKLPGASYVTLIVYDVLGNVVRVLLDGLQGEGVQELPWDGKDIAGTPVSAGSYMYELSVRPAQVVGDPGFSTFTAKNLMIIVR